MTDLTVVPFKREPTVDVIAALEEIISLIKSGEIPSVDSGCVVTMSKDGQINSFGFGEKSEDANLVFLLRLAEQMIVDDCLGGGE